MHVAVEDTGSPAERWTTGGPVVLDLTDSRASDAAFAGAKAANLAKAAAAGLPVLPGFVITTSIAEAPNPEAEPTVEAAWRSLSRGGELRVVVRSSSTVEDIGTSSMAGQFTSVLDVGDGPNFASAVEIVLQSAGRPRDLVSEPQPMAVLVQVQVDAVCGGVLFGMDPITGDDRIVVVEAVPRGPDAVVSGAVPTSHVALSRSGRIVQRRGLDPRELLTRSRRRRLVRLARQTRRVFGGPQDVEWAFDGADRLWLLQSRPVTAAGAAVPAHGPVLGPGPVAETFPDPLRPLEEDLWVRPLREGILGALHATGAVSTRRLAASPVVTTVQGWVAADLDLFGVVPPRRPVLHRLNPVPPARHLIAAWRVGRLRAALPALATDVVARVDSDLTAVPDLDTLDDSALVELLDGVVDELVAVHGHEVLAGMLLRQDTQTVTAASVALWAVGRGRRDHLTDDQIVARDPVVLALVPPAIGQDIRLPAVAGPPAGTAKMEQLAEREALRLRFRWLQELSARAADLLGRRWAAAGYLDSAGLVAWMRLSELHQLVDGGAVPADLSERQDLTSGPALPAMFQLTPTGTPVALGTDASSGIPAGGGRGVGVVREVDSDELGVLVVRTLDPRLASQLPHLQGLVSETGNPLCHLAILAREYGVPTVVAVPDAVRRFPPGAVVVVDGTSGTVTEPDTREAVVRS